MVNDLGLLLARGDAMLRVLSILQPFLFGVLGCCCCPRGVEGAEGTAAAAAAAAAIRDAANFRLASESDVRSFAFVGAASAESESEALVDVSLLRAGEYDGVFALIVDDFTVVAAAADELPPMIIELLFSLRWGVSSLIDLD